LPFGYLIGLCAALAIAWTGTVLIGTRTFLGQSMLSLLQGAAGAPVVRTAPETAPPPDVDISKSAIFAKVMGALKQGKRSMASAMASTWRHHARHVLRAPVRSLLIAGVALIFMLALGWLNETINITEREIDRLYLTTPVTGSVEFADEGDLAARLGFQNGVSHFVYQSVTASEFVINPRVSVMGDIRLLPQVEPTINMSLDDFRDEYFFGGEWSEDIWQNPLYVQYHEYTIGFWEALEREYPLLRIYGVDNLNAFIEESSRPLGNIAGLGLENNLEITFAPGFGPEDFSFNYEWDGWDSFITTFVNEAGETVYTMAHIEPEMLTVPSTWNVGRVSGGRQIQSFDMYFTNPAFLLPRQYPQDPSPIPVIVYEYWLEYFDSYNLGDILRVGSGIYGFVAEVQIIGSYAGGNLGINRGMILTPIEGLMSFRNSPAEVPFRELTFSINPTMTRQIDDFLSDESVLESLRTYSIDNDDGEMEWVYRYLLLLDDSELRLVVTPLKDNLYLLTVLYPIAVTLSFVIAMVLTLLLMLQNAKNAAILRVLGKPKWVTRLTLCGELLVLCVTGLIPGVGAMLAMGLGLVEIWLPLAGIYFAGAVIGSVLGVYVISLRTPLELLQVRE
jgi:hypothetical protein